MLSWPKPKDPNAFYEYQFDWSQWLSPGEQITSSEFLVQGSITTEDESIDGGMTTFWARGGTAGDVCYVTNRISTNQGRSDDQTSRLRIREN